LIFNYEMFKCNYLILIIRIWTDFCLFNLLFTIVKYKVLLINIFYARILILAVIKNKSELLCYHLTVSSVETDK